MTTLTEFLLARIAEDEGAALNTLDQRLGFRWRTLSWLTEANRDFGHRFDPDRVLAECAAKRKIIDHAAEATGLDLQVDGEFRVGGRDTDTEPYLGVLILRALAAPYASHPDFDSEWGGL